MAVLRRIGFVGTIFLLLLTARAFAYQQIEFVREIEPGKQTKQHELNAPRALAAYGERLYVADTDGHRVVVLDQNWKTVLAWGMKGNKPGQFRSPAGIAIDERGRVYVVDTGNHRIQVFDGEGKWLRSFGVKGDGPHEFGSPSGIAVNRELLYVADTGNGRVQVLTVDGIFIGEMTV